MRQFGYITVGKILNDLWQDLKDSGASEDNLWYTDKKGRRKKKLPISRLTFLRLEERLGFPERRRTSGTLRWRVYSEEQAEEVKNKIKKEYNLANT